MSAFNAVRFRVKPGRDKDFLDAHNNVRHDWPGLKHANIIKTGDNAYCIIAKWADAEALAQARPKMIATLNSFRDTLDDLGGGLGVTDAVSGPFRHVPQIAPLGRFPARTPDCRTDDTTLAGTVTSNRRRGPA
jgi:Antibiotic biosynthesis monooxygenase